MSRLGRDKQREHEGAERSPDSVATPIDVRVPEGGPGVRGARVDGSLVVAAPGEEIQNAVLNRLHRLALAAGHPVLATIHDRRLGYSVPLRVDPDGSSHLAGDPAPTEPGSVAPAPADPAPVASAPAEPGSVAPAPADPAPVASAPADPPSAARASAAPASAAPASMDPASAAPAPMDPASVAPAPASPAPADPEETPVRHDLATHVLRLVTPAGDGVPTFTLRALPEPAGDGVPTFTLRALPEPAGGTPPGTVAPPTGVFGPPPVMDTGTAGVPEDPEPRPMPTPAPRPTPAAPDLGPRPDPYADPDPKPTPARGFDAVAEAVLGDAPLTAPGDATTPALLAEPTARINEAVKEGRTQDAARLAEHTAAEASDTLGPEHPEVLRLRELTAYIAYLSGDPDRAFRLSLDLARIHRRAGDAEAAYGNVQSAATAWRGVRDPARGLELGHDLVGLWDELAAEDGPAAEEAEELESVRARMGRLTARARVEAG
ncbi:tetratricopeptide repeat protein [Streptomyces ardesiacus]|uniref:tetratricopeptide repeat protein n=1 Tax=Streptomyces ardesiacus TaxID=285564 RepID=UPI00142E672A|nr:tetratricopeptide repeat protein [Streptomyces ardesiacus]